MIIAGALLYALTASPLFVYCISSNGHRQIELASCLECEHLKQPIAAAGQLSSAVSYPHAFSTEECGDCMDFDLMLVATERGDSDKSLPPAPALTLNPADRDPSPMTTPIPRFKPVNDPAVAPSRSSNGRNPLLM